MKILMMTPYIASVYGGIPKVVRELANALGQQVLVDLITTNANESERLNVPINTWVDEGNYRIRYFDSWCRSDLVFSSSLLSWLWQHCKDYTLLHSHTLFSPLNALVHRICQWQQLPYIMTPHGMLEPWALAYKAWKKKGYYRLVEQGALRGAAAIHALTLTEVGQIRDLGLETPVLIPNGIHREQFEQLPSPQLLYDAFPHLQGKSLILFLGRIDPKKGLDLLAQAYAQVAAVHPNIHLVIAGPDSINFLPTVQGYFEQAGCGDRLTLTGMLNGQLKLAALAAAQIYVAPSYSEGFSMSILEGMASALPCVFTTGCNFSEAAQANVAYEVAIDGDAIADALMDCLQSPHHAQVMGQRAQQFIFEHYEWNCIAAHLKQVYTATLRNIYPRNFLYQGTTGIDVDKV